MVYSNVVTIIATIVAWLIIGGLVLIKHKKLQDKPKLWKVILIVIVGMFSFTINLNFQGVSMRIPILPLGVLLLMFAFRNKGESWQKYRIYAWIGFLGQFIFILTSLLTIPVNSVLYPEEELSTYIANTHNANIIQTHPSGEEYSLNKEILSKQIKSMKQESVYSEQWYQELTVNPDSTKVNERFPYVVIDTLPKWGSGFEGLIYLEKDGKGLLVSTAAGQYYFRGEVSVLMEEQR
ncbi:hypothetical protein E3U55_03365 [Filobacillus milosensis]|uniref:Uncharacterized protein n=1 Tax=Filobacillus milosensis TaxID=94137 RepID=A0A4Y8ISV0_9BACI|nr:hypothetical protein [Filobacillus milosensis]TFB23867.1 hypothetical protein E3U55_03365 [Filobacillus milosensis]